MRGLIPFVKRWRAPSDLERRFGQFRRELELARHSKRTEAVARLVERRAELDLSEDDVALELEMVDALRFRCNTYSDAMRGAVIGRWLRNRL